MNQSVWQVFGSIGLLANAYLAILSVIGALFMLLFPKLTRQFAGWGVGAWLFAVFFEICLRLSGPMPEQVGLGLTMSPLVVEGLLLVTAGLLGIRLTLRKRMPV